MATLLFLGSLTMLLLGALVYLWRSPTSGRSDSRFPTPRGWSCCEPGPGRLTTLKADCGPGV